MEREKVFAFTAGCFNGEPASCTYACPFRLDLRSFLKKAARGRWDAASKELTAAVLFPAVICELCPRPCEQYCQRDTVLGDAPVSVGLIERACLRYAKKKERASYTLPPRPERTAVIGAGPSGLSCALLLDRKRYSVTVFEKNSDWGGSLREHPLFNTFDAEFTRCFADSSVEFRFDTEIDSTDTLSEYDAVFIATGRGGIHFGLLDSVNDELGYTSNPRFFLGGELTGLSLIEGMAHAARAARAIEAFLQSGNPSFASEAWDSSKRTRYAPHDGAAALPPVIPAGDGEYTDAEAVAEAARCMGCDCEYCMNSCELLIKYKKKPPRIANDVFQDGQGRNSVSAACITRQTWSCNLCGRCTSKCAMEADPCGLFQYSRTDRVQSGNYPPAIHDYWLRELNFVSGTAELAANPKNSKYVFFPGCRLGSSNVEYVRRSYAFLKERLDAGIILDCCGLPALWAGEDNIFREHLQKLKDSWGALGSPTLVLACTGCGKTLSQFLPEIPYIYIYETLAETALKIDAPAEKYAVFDPCTADYGAVKQVVRNIARTAGIELDSFDSDGKCCGFGGHIQLADPALYEEVVKNRCEDTEAPYIVYCANCRDVFDASGKRCKHILELAFGLESHAAPTLEKRRENLLELKKELSLEILGERFEPERKPWDNLRISLSPEIQAKMERNLITLSDVRETVWRTEESGGGFVCNGKILGSIAGDIFTRWVQYYKENKDGEDIIIVENVYSHRMRIRGEGANG